MTGLIMAAQLIMGLSVLVVLHELGHFLAARAFGIKVEKFYLFFDAWNFKLFSFKRGDTEYGIGWLPLGGYVKIAGMVDESMDKEAMKLPPQPWEFRSKPAWQRLIVMIAGVTMNVLLAILIFWMLVFKTGETYVPNSEVKHGIVAFELAQSIGLKTGDKIVAINGEPFDKFEDLISSKVLFGNSTLTVLRDSQQLTITVPPDFIERLSEKGREQFIEPRFTFYVREVVSGSNADKGGLAEKDVIQKINGTPVPFYNEMQKMLKENAGKTTSIEVLRNGNPVVLKIDVNEDGTIGFFPERELRLKTTNYGFFESFPVGLKKSWQVLSDNVKGLGKIFRGEVSAANSVQGPIGIAKIYGGEWDWIRFWSMTGLLSMVLAFMNILPIPALDGGHVIFLFVEALSGRKLSDSFMEKAQVTGMIILLSIMVFAVGNDLWKIFR